MNEPNNTLETASRAESAQASCSAILDDLESEAEAAWRAEDARIQQVSPELRLDVAAVSQYLRGIADGIRRAELALRGHLPN